MNDALDLTIGDWLIPADYIVTNPCSTILWEFARESLTIVELASKMKKTVSSLAEEGVQSSHIESLPDIARQHGYAYREYLFHSSSGRTHDLNSAYFAGAKELDRIMPDTDWRFVLVDAFPNRPIWGGDNLTVAPKKRRNVESAQPTSELRKLVHPLTQKPESASRFYANDFEWNWEGFWSATSILPESVSPSSAEVQSVIFLMPIDQVAGRSAEEVSYLFSECIRQYHRGLDQTEIELNGISMIALEETVVPGSNLIPLSQGSLETLRRWSGDDEYASLRFRGLVIPISFMQSGPALLGPSITGNWPGWARIDDLAFTEGGGVWRWNATSQQAALRRLGALRAKAGGLTFSQVEDGLIEFTRALAKIAENLPTVDEVKWCDAQMKFRPFYNKTSAFHEAAAAAPKDFSAVFPALKDELPRTLLYRGSHR